MADSPRAALKKPLHLHGFLPGGILGFAACQPSGALIRMCTGRLICCGGLSHVGIVTWWPLHRRYVLCESTSLADEPCLIQDRPVSGVQVHHIRSRVLAYPGKVWYYPPAHPVTWHEAGLLYLFCKKHLGVPYDYFGAADARHTLLARLVRRIRGEDLDKVFCSEFVAEAHRAIGMIQTDNASAFSPNRLVRHERRLNVIEKPRRIK